ncbi:hypothetical protein LUTEI9C_140075 [Luteimonas sp. 9C]|nr:hypothetical protein LUTEI9C_140075 [Luteimonas sp. 9C]
MPAKALEDRLVINPSHDPLFQPFYVLIHLRIDFVLHRGEARYVD